MKDGNALRNRAARRMLMACAQALALAFTVGLSQPAHAAQITPPQLPADLDEVPPGNKPFLEGHGVGTQNYVCLPSASSNSGVAYVLFTPQATLLKDNDRQVITHFFSPNPSERNTNPALVADGLIRATWQHSRDGSTVWAKLRAHGSSLDPGFVAQGAIAWLSLEKAGVQEGPTGGDTLTATTFVLRVNTSGGLAPSTGCNSPADIGHEAFVPYTADYIFYKAAGGGE